MQMKRVAFKNVRCLRIGQSTVNRAQVSTELDVRDFERQRALVEGCIGVVQFEFENKSSTNQMQRNLFALIQATETG